MSTDFLSSLSAGLTSTLDRHGHSFHYAILKHCQNLFSRLSEAAWTVEATEFPVQAGGVDTRIDFILRARSDQTPVTLFLACECKRANPALSSWCFARAPLMRRTRSHRAIVEILRRPHNQHMMAHAAAINSTKPYHLAFALKSGQKGDPHGEQRDVIDEAATQVLRGFNGLCDFMHRNENISIPSHGSMVVPVIFTTASLFTTEANLATAELSTGNLPAPAEVEPATWLWFQHHQSPSLSHSMMRYHPTTAMQSLGGVLEVEHARSIAIVSVDGVESFLRSLAVGFPDFAVIEQ
jgi:hypothetical protein